MIRIDPSRMSEVAAWPHTLLTNRPGGDVTGFVMPRLTGFQPIQHLYNPGQRRKYFPRANWQSLLHVAINTAKVFDEIHKLGCLVGDINQSNLLISESGRPKIIDCDSFQITTNGRSYFCEVGVELYTPPELQSIPSFKGILRTPNHDRFGIAVLIFQLLFLGRHPYAGIFQGAGDPEYKQLIKEFRFAYGPNASRLRMLRPPHTPDLNLVTPELGRMFELAFLPGSDSMNARPTASSWIEALDKLRSAITQCKVNPGHKFSGHLSQCPWCAVMTTGVQDYFVGVAAVPTVFQFDAARLNTLVRKATLLAKELVPYQREELSSIGDIIAEPPPINPQEHRLLNRILGGMTGIGAFVMMGGLRVKFLGLFGLVVALAFGLWWAIHTSTSPLAKERRRRKQILAVEKDTLWQLEDDWIAESNGYLRKGEVIRDRIESLRHQAERFQENYSSERRQLESNRETLARDEHLRSQFIIDAKIAGIGPGRIQRLASYNIETAFDIRESRILEIKGFGPLWTNKLISWRNDVLSEFRFDSKSGVPETDLQVLAARFAKLQADQFAEIDRNTILLENIVTKLNSRKREVTAEITAAFRDWAHARANFEACG